MVVGDFEFILGKISHLISPRQMSNFGGHLPIMPDERLALTLRYIATGKSFQSLSFQFRISLTAVSYIIKGCCNALVDELVPVFVKTPSSEQEWLEISTGCPHVLETLEMSWNLFLSWNLSWKPLFVLEISRNVLEFYFNMFIFSLVGVNPLIF